MLTLNVGADSLKITLQDSYGKFVELDVSKSEDRAKHAAQNNRYFHNVKFAEPLSLEHHPVIGENDIS